MQIKCLGIILVPFFLITQMPSSNEDSAGKRVLPEWLKGLLEADKRWTKDCCEAFDRSCGLAQHRSTFKYLEISCHGIPWIGGTFAMLYFYPEGAYLWMNLLWLLVLDVVVVAIIKVRSLSSFRACQ